MSRDTRTKPSARESAEGLLTDFRQGSLRALSRLISLAENADPRAAGLLAQLYPGAGQARLLGLTGPPGAGKSTLTNALVRFHREAGEKVAVIAVDPVSPFTGGALLGDRIRLVDHFNDPGVYIRSLSTRGKLGGLSLATREVCHAVDAFGFRQILLETVGVGQSEVDVRKIADLTLVVLVPEWGDGVQALKAGVLEIGDIFVVHKADREGADRVVQELRNALALSGKQDLPVLTTSIHDPASLQNLFTAVGQAFADRAAAIAARRRAAVRETLLDLLESRMLAAARGWAERQPESGNANPYQAMAELEKSGPWKALFPS
jgi:LAO/AO transport system kinase